MTLYQTDSVIYSGVGKSPHGFCPPQAKKMKCFSVASTHGLPQVEKLFDSGKVIWGDIWSLFSIKNMKEICGHFSLLKVGKIFGSF